MGYNRAGFVSSVLAMLLYAYLLPSNANAGSGAINATVTIPIVPWNKIVYPEGIYEPAATGLPGTHRFAFNLTFLNFSAAAGTRVQCTIRRSDGSMMYLNKSVAQTGLPKVEYMAYTLQPSDPVNKHTPWVVENCSLISAANQVLYSTNSSYYSPLNRRILVHGNQWTRFGTFDDDAYLARECFDEVPKRYFNNSYKCDFAGDIGYAVSMSRGMALEGSCADGVDGSERNGDVDCADIYCKGIAYTCAQHVYVGDPFGGICRNGLCWETKRIGGKDVTYTYTRYVGFGGSLKVVFQATDYSTSKPISFALTGFPRFQDHGGYPNRGSHIPSSEVVTRTSYAVGDPGGYYGSMEFALYVNPQDVRPGWNSFNIYIAQYGKDLLIEGIPYYVSESAPLNWDEKDSMSPSIVKPCSDGLDNDLNFVSDCRDSSCDGESGGKNCVGADTVCEYGSEDACNDCFDNDADNRTDCQDPDCNGKPGNHTNPALTCEYGCEGCGEYYPAHCQDGFDNDGNGKTDCWDAYCRGKGGDSTALPCPSRESLKPEWCADGKDNDYNGAIDCKDYSCRNVQLNARSVCPYSEAYKADGTYAPDQCFDGVDNDLDNPDRQYRGPGANIDCSDPDCAGATNPRDPSKTCSMKEYDPDNGVNLCDDGIDNDGNGRTDCADQACTQKFGICGPCPNYENYHWDSCSNAFDDDFDWVFGSLNETDCRDTECVGELGRVDGADRCEASESSCDDGFDNDGNGLADCADPACLGMLGPQDGVCARNESTAALCQDNVDNDGDGRLDCADPDCWYVADSGCSPKFWSQAPAFEVPYETPLSYINYTTVQYSHLERLHINDSYQIRLKSTSSLGAVIITLGDATDPNRHFPYNASSCTMTGTPSLRWVSTQDEVGQIQHRPSFVGSGSQLAGFDVTLRCSPPSSAQSVTYPVTVTNLRDGIPEFGEANLTSSAYNLSNPTVVKIELAPHVGDTVNLGYGGYFDVRAIPSQDVAGVSQCYFNISGIVYVASSECVYRYSGAVDDATALVAASVQDGLGNRGPYNAPKLVTINIRPWARNLTVDPVFLRTGDNVHYRLSMMTASSGNFPSATCTMRVSDGSGSEVDTSSVIGIAQANSLLCDGEYRASGLQNGAYNMRGYASDEDGDTAQSLPQIFYVCNDYTSSGDGWDCSRADFDMDGIPDICVINGSVTTSTTTTTLANETQIAQPSETGNCTEVCRKYYDTDMAMCNADMLCSVIGSTWMWTHDDRGDRDCYAGDETARYCCCQLEGLVPPTTLPENIRVLCANGVQDPGEIEQDCGGICPPCDHCYNRFQDQNEEGIDCGGSCLPCLGANMSFGEQPKLYVMGVDAYATVGSNVTFHVVDDRGIGTQAYLEYTMPNGSKLLSVTDINGRAQMESTMVGLWTVEARRPGYMPVTAVWASLPPMSGAVAVAATSSVLLPLILALWALNALMRRRKGYAATEGSLKVLVKSDAISRYAPILVTSKTYAAMPNLRSYLRTVRLSYAEETKADDLSQEYDLPTEVAELVIASRKLKIAKLLIEKETELKEYHLTELVLVWEAQAKGPI
jgi:hypothetical protein